MTFVIDLWERQPGKYFCISTKSASGAWRDEFFTRDEFDEIDDFVSASNGKDVYACPHGLSRRRRVKTNAVLPKLLWADLDEANPRHIELRPTIAIESSPGRYVGLWETDRVVTEELNKRLTYHIGADKGGWDLGQVLRLVIGTRNHKYATKPRVRLLWDDGPSYKVRNLERELPILRSRTRSNAARHSDIDFGNLPNYRDVQSKYPKAKARNGVRIRRYMGPGRHGKRSDVVHAIGCAYALEGATPEEIASVIMASGSFQAKWGDSTMDAAREVASAISKCER